MENAKEIIKKLAALSATTTVESSQLLFEFDTAESMSCFWQRLYHPAEAEQLIWPHEVSGKFYAGFNTTAVMDMQTFQAMTETWVSLCAAHQGQVHVFNYKTNP